MTSIRYVAALLLLALSASLARADGLLYQLPKDGRWESYDVDVSMTMGGDAPQMSIKGTLRMASVGQTTEKEQPCRWIEVRFKAKIEVGGHGQEQDETYKVLIPEKFLAKGQSPMEHVVRAWKQHGDSAPTAFENPSDFNASPLLVVLSGPWKDAKKLDKEEVQSKLGKLACEGVEGSLEFKAGKEGTVKCKIENRLHPDSPFGVVTSRWTLTPPEGGPIKMGPMRWNYKLADFGDNAKSRMPDAK